MLFLDVERHVVGFPAPQDRVDRFIERTHTVEPSDRAIKPSALVAMYTTIFRLWTIAPKRRPNPNAEPLTLPSRIVVEESASERSTDASDLQAPRFVTQERRGDHRNQSNAKRR